MSEINENKVIQVCSECKRASCWYGEFLCENSYAASTELKTVKELREIKAAESEHYWSDEYMTKVYGSANPFGACFINKGFSEEEYAKAEEEIAQMERLAEIGKAFLWSVEIGMCEKVDIELLVEQYRRYIESEAE